MSASESSSNSTLESLLRLPLYPVRPLDFADFKIYDETGWLKSFPEDDGLYEIIDVKPCRPLPQLPSFSLIFEMQHVLIKCKIDYIVLFSV